MIDCIRIHNLRSLKDTDFVNLKKINILLGVNDVGKSTFLRSFPLLTQSISKQLREPISWADDSMVDFGDYQTSKYNHADPDDPIQLTFRLTPPYTKTSLFHSTIFGHERVTLSGDYTVCISYSHDRHATYVGCLEISKGVSTCKFVFDGNNFNTEIFVDGQRVKIGSKLSARWGSNSSLFPEIFNVEKKDEYTYHFSADQLLYREIITYLHKLIGNKLKNESRLGTLLPYEEISPEKVLSRLKKSNLITLQNKVADWRVDTPEFVALYNLIFTYNILRVYPQIEYEIEEFYRECGYIAPLRAEASRYYRTQNLRIDDIDAYGKNLPEFIASLSEGMRASLNAFVKSTIGESVVSSNSNGHISLELNTDGRRVNMTDKGFGISQILPILVKLWLNKERPHNRRTNRATSNQNLTLMEQPELHLHPAMQAKVADTFVRYVTLSEPYQDSAISPVVNQLMIETHSPTIVNRIGKRIRDGWINPDDINVILFFKTPDKDYTLIKQVKYNKNGVIEEWPYGFFDPED